MTFADLIHRTFTTLELRILFGGGLFGVLLVAFVWALSKHADRSDR